MVGSLAYLPPERLLGEPYDERADIDPAGGGTRRPFGAAFLANDRTWNRALAELDTDGEGWSNGQELGAAILRRHRRVRSRADDLVFRSA